MSTTNEKHLISLAIKMGMITSQQLQQCLAIQKQQGNIPLMSVLNREGYLSEQQINDLWRQSTNQRVVDSQTNAGDNTNYPQASTPTKKSEYVPSFGRYEIICELGRGGMGRVYKVYDQQLRREIALKMLLLGTNDNDTDFQRFQREARATANLNHPNIVRVYDIGIEDSYPYFTMDLINGGSLKERMKNLSIRQAVDAMMKITDAIHHAHGQGIIHRDLKPANIMFDDNNEPVIMDFGLAKTSKASRKLSRTGTVMGTLHYMPPEQAGGRSRDVDARSDVYGLGAVFYEILTGKPPFTTTNYAQILNQIINVVPMPPTKIKPRIPKDLENICMKCLEKKKEKRYQTAAALKRDLQRFARGEKLEASSGMLRKTAMAWQKYQKILMFAGIFVMMVAAFLLGKSFDEPSSKTKPQEKQTTQTPPQKTPKETSSDAAENIPFAKEIWQAGWDTQNKRFDFSHEKWRNLSFETQKQYARQYQIWYASENNLSLTKKVRALNMIFVLVPPGVMYEPRKPKKQKREKKLIVIPRAFYISKHEITQEQWQQMGMRIVAPSPGRNIPVKEINVLEIEEFCKRMNNKHGRSGFFRPPHQKEWIYGCMAGSTYKYNIGDKLFPSQANIHMGKPVSIEKFAKFANAWGGCSFHGNVGEWMENWRYGGRWPDDPSHIFKAFHRSSFLGKKEVYNFGIGGNIMRIPFVGFRLAIGDRVFDVYPPRKKKKQNGK
ncbi:bifunctional serine/threonine-protein kinase/formylglycine-generating enzyme family protein [Candidatus Uabimicrobium amorphum]|uniref:non-specific serine/threonine protein kinase n=1 Tax=Uabimicrobium amorphum TaxID=2596890 RepID=A0A5S9IST3_UABAM|nr:bifunctional serine/threonine-protein kinase/formylglycine-generating enzyme family protein [Candidatus Uabimicrobium amorphum]BBM86490.1 protein kinase [Candidatus Uabimicrobium amorphum]